MYCSKCGSQIPDNSKFCPHCGNGIGAGNSDDSGSGLWILIGLLVPLVGLILYLVWADSKPKTARQVGKGALIAVCIASVLALISFLIWLTFAIIGVSGVFYFSFSAVLL